MIQYTLDKTQHDRAVARLRDMQKVLDEISPSLQVLRKVLAEHEAAIKAPSLNSYRNEMIQAVTQAIGQTHQIAREVEKLSKVSEQTARHLAAIDEHYGSALRAETEETQSTANIAG